ncbi:MAG: hypothetical protein ACLQU3_09310 [Limisphaerales bacterium]
MNHTYKVDVLLAHEVDVSKATRFLLHQLDCDDWYVACHQESLFVYHLTKGATDRYAVSFQCTPPVEKGIYHGSRAWSLSIIPLHGGEALPEAKENEIKGGLAELT